MTKILLTGGAGFIGSHIAEGYIKNKCQVVVIDNLSSGKKQHLNPSAVFINGDITDQKLVKKVFLKHGPFDIVNHHAAQKSVTASAQDPVEDARQNIIGSLIIFEQAKKFKTKKIIFASTGGALYGDDAPCPAREDSPINPAAPYGIAKFSTERYLNYYSKEGIIVQILRYANVYGPRQDPYGEAGVVAIFCARLLNGNPLIIYGSGKQTRDFIFVDDVVSANLKLINFPNSGIWNIGTSRETTVNNIAKKLIDLASKKIDIIYKDERLGELKRSCIVTKKAQRDFNWTSRVNINQGLKQTFESFE